MEKKEPKSRKQRWDEQYEAVWDFVEKNHRGPSRHHIEEHKLLNWMKANRKARNKGNMPEDRVKTFKRLTDYIASFNRVNHKHPIQAVL